MKNNAGKIVFAAVVAALLILVGTLSYIHISDGQLAYSGAGDSVPDADTAPNTGSDPPPTTAFDLAPDFNYITVNSGASVSLSGLRGKVVILDFMAMWCGPCGTQMTYLKQIYSEYPSSSVVIISLDVDLQELPSDLVQYRAEKGAQWDFVMDSDRLGSNPRYNAASIPTMVFINKSGEIAQRNVGVMDASALRAAIDPLL